MRSCLHPRNIVGKSFWSVSNSANGRHYASTDSLEPSDPSRAFTGKLGLQKGLQSITPTSAGDVNVHTEAFYDPEHLLNPSVRAAMSQKWTRIALEEGDWLDMKCIDFAIFVPLKHRNIHAASHCAI